MPECPTLFYSLHSYAKLVYSMSEFFVWACNLLQAHLSFLSQTKMEVRIQPTQLRLCFQMRKL